MASGSSSSCLTKKGTGMTINSSKTYTLLHTQISFARNVPFLKKIKEQYGLEIPYIDFPKLTPELQDALDQYIYLEDLPSAKESIHRLCHQYSTVSFTVLGKVKGKEILDLIKSCLDELKSSVIVGDTYKILNGPLKNLHVIIQGTEGEYAHVTYEVLNETRKLTLPITHLAETPALNPEKGFRDLLTEARNLKKFGAVIIDGSFSLHKSCFGYDTVYTKGGRFVGGCQGFYFDILRYKELYPDREIHVVFDSETKIAPSPNYKGGKIKYSRKWKEAYRDNFSWCERLVKALGYHLYKVPDVDASDVICSLARHLTKDMGYSDVLIYSANRDFYSIVNDKISVILPKKSFRGNSRTITAELALEEFKVNHNRKINWVRALSGDLDGSLAANQSDTKYTPFHYLPIVNESDDLKELRGRLLTDLRFTEFVQSGKFDLNLEKLAMRDDFFTRRDNLSAYKSKYDKQAFLGLLEEVWFYRELEGLGRIEKILQSKW